MKIEEKMPKQSSMLKKKVRLVNSYIKKLPLYISWQVTYRCNFKCCFCDYWKDNKKHRNEATLEGIKEGSRNLAKKGSCLVTLGGGEPFLRRDLPDIVSIMAQDHFPMVVTNGWLVTRKKAREIYRAGLFGASISIDFADPEKHDGFRGVKGAYDRAIAAVRYFIEERDDPGKRVNMIATLSNQNIGEIEKLIKIAENLGATFMVQPYCPLKTSGAGEFKPTPNVSARLLELKKKYKTFLSNVFYLSRFDQSLSGGVGGCLAGRSFFNIDNYGRAAICVEERDKPLGSIVDDPIDAVLDRLHEEQKTNTCQACWYSCRGEIEALYSLNGFFDSLPRLLY
jgi:MoaA/NifB/PqqE/SkfB family radical SAM enzyme